MNAGRVKVSKELADNLIKSIQDRSQVELLNDTAKDWKL